VLGIKITLPSGPYVGRSFIIRSDPRVHVFGNGRLKSVRRVDGTFDGIELTVRSELLMNQSVTVEFESLSSTNLFNNLLSRYGADSTTACPMRKFVPQGLRVRFRAGFHAL
jgi:hypothetical protein